MQLIDLVHFPNILAMNQSKLQGLKKRRDSRTAKSFLPELNYFPQLISALQTKLGWKSEQKLDPSTRWDPKSYDITWIRLFSFSLQAEHSAV